MDKFGVFKFPSGKEVKNIEGTKVCEPIGYDSWKQFYTEGKRLEWPEECRICYCTNKAEHGAHVRIKYKPAEVLIIPMCSEDNNPSNREWMTVNAKTNAVYVGKRDTSGPASRCYSS